MSDPISRNQIYSYVKTIINPYGKPFKGTAYELGLKIMDYIKNMSSVELPVRGEWEDWCEQWKQCSQCKHRIQLFYAKGFNFCPNCGADMRGEIND